MQYVIVGNGTAATSAIETIRESDKKGKIAVISDESYFNYSRPLISYLLGKKVTVEKMAYRDKNFYTANRVDLILDNKAKKLDLKKKYVILADSQKIPFDKLLITTGGAPIIPEIKGRNLKGVFAFTKLADARRIEKYIKANKTKKAVVLGGGLIGLKATEALIELKIKVTIVELTDRILSATFDKKASGVIEGVLKKIGCKLIANNTIAEIKGKNKKLKEVVLKGKKRVPADLVIMAIGVVPNIELTNNTPIKTNKGILVNDYLQTSVRDIYAAGDCCEAKDLLLEMNWPIAIWPVAVRQGKIAGYNMAGIKKEYQGNFTMNSVELCGVPTVSVGRSYTENESYQILDYFAPEKSVYRKVVLKKGRIVGAIFVGDIERAGIYTGLIKDKIDVSDFKENLLKEDFGLISLPGEYRKHLVTGEVAML